MGMDAQILTEYPHRRLNALTGEWVLVSPHRSRRPWQGQIEQAATPTTADYDPECYLCPRNPRAGGHRNPDYEATYAFDNDFPALLPESPPGDVSESGLLVARAERGVSRVLCFSPNHGLTLGRMEAAAVAKVVDRWLSEFAELGARPYIDYVQIFENRGEMMGCSNQHPHCQIWAAETIPNEVAREDARQRDWAESHDSCLLCDYLALEQRQATRVVCENASFVALVPFWAVWPSETMVVSTRHLGVMDEMSREEQWDLADILKRLVTRYDNLFETPFPYTMGFHQRPTDARSRPWFHFHAHYYPPLLRSATVRKFMVGFELLGTPQRDITPESAAERLREVSEIHYLDR